MSLILEALRKSEAERQRAQVPGLHAPVSVPAPVRAKPGWGPWIAAVVGAVLLAGTWWVSRPAPVDVAKPVVAPTVPEAIAATPPAPVEPAPVPDVPPPEPAPLPPTEVGDPIVEAPPDPTQAAPVATPPEPAPAPIVEPAPPAAEYVPTLATLAAAERAALPPLKVSMFVWSPEPARRFAIVDGQRIGEGALLAGGTVAEIRSDGVVIELAGRRLLLPRP